VARRIRELIPVVRAQSPRAMKVELLADQSTFVTRAVDGLIVEGLIAAGLTAAAILLFLGSLRSTLVVAISIPLSVTVALLAMRALGQTLNIMTLAAWPWRSACWSTTPPWRSRTSTATWRWASG